MSVAAEVAGTIAKLTAGAFRPDTVSIDNWCFKLFYKWTTTMLVLFSILVTARQYFGSPIQVDNL